MKMLATKDWRLINLKKVETYLEVAWPKMKREINRAMDLFKPRREEEDTD